MFEIRFHGRGGQGAVTAAELFALSAFIEGKEAQHFPQFGSERRGAPVAAFCRIDAKPIIVHSNIYEPDCAVVLDISLVKTIKVVAGLKKDGCLILNTGQVPEEFESLGASKIAVIDATTIALSHRLGSEKAPIVNTTILGSLAAVTGIVKLDSVFMSIKEKIEKNADANIRACEEAYNRVQIKIFPKGGEENVENQLRKK